jgi:phage-related protein
LNSPCQAPIPIVFYRTRAGGEPVREWLKGLEEGDRRAMGQDLQRVQFRWPIGMPLCRALQDGLWEVRTRLPSNKVARVLFFKHGEALVALTGFIKKTRKTPDDEMKLATSRKKEVEHGG